MTKTCSGLIPLIPLIVVSVLCSARAAARADDARWADGEIIVAAAAGRGADVRLALGGAGCVVLETDALSGVMRVSVPTGEEHAFVQVFLATPGVAYAERNGRGAGGTVPDDTYFTKQWHLQNTGQLDGLRGADIACVEAWDMATGSPTVVTAVLDTGIDSDHPDFAGRIDADGYDFVNEDDDPEADHPHGTWVSGCLAANADNDFGVAGVDWGCWILPIKVLDENNSGTSFDLAQGINYAADQDDVRIISMSLINYPGSAAVLNALENARDANKILVACAGNGGIGDADQSYPGAAPTTIAIGATTRHDGRASFSGTGNALDFVAPGQDISTSWHGSGSDLRAVVSGCSFATPITAGVVGLMIDRAEAICVELDHEQVQVLLKSSVDDQVGPPHEDGPGWDVFFGYGRINAARSVAAVAGLGRRADVDSDGDVGFVDLILVLDAWGPCPACPEDVIGDGVVDVSDVFSLIAAWGPCS